MCIKFVIVLSFYCSVSVQTSYPILTTYLDSLEKYLNQSESINTTRHIEYFDVYTNSDAIFNNTKSGHKLRAKNMRRKHFVHHVQKILPLNYDTNFKQKVLNNFKNLLQVLKTDSSHLNISKDDDRQNMIEDETDDKKMAEKRLLNLFTVINFNNDACFVDNAYGSFNGTCYHATECKKLGGISIGMCGHPYGVCCIFQYTCGENSNKKLTYFVSPKYPKPSRETYTCSFTLEKTGPDIVQVRVDLEMLEILPPVNGTCVNDQLIISGQNINSIVPIICGINNGQHVYLDVMDSNTPLMFTVISSSDHESIFRVKLTQLSGKRWCPMMNCLQYFTGINGTFETFNYKESGTVIYPNSPGYLNNLNYAVCIKKSPGYCTITYTNIDETGYEYPFQLLNLDEDGTVLFPPNQAGAEIFNCPDDFVIVNGIRLCGERFNDGSITSDFRTNAPVTDYSAGPFVFPVRTNQQTNGRGFKLFYRQNKCTN